MSPSSAARWRTASSIPAGSKPISTPDIRTTIWCFATWPFPPTRSRCGIGPAGFGSPDEWLTKVQADVIFAFFGFNESFQGKAGLEKFKADLDSFLKTTLEKNYSGKGHPRIVLFSPIANERTQDPNFPDPVRQ